MKKCIWCLETDLNVSFNTVAHTVPQSLGGKNICINVCDQCNHYFGNHQDQKPPIDNVIKEAFNISRARFLNGTKQIGKNRALSRFKSSYFKVNFEKGTIDIKQTFKLKKDFQQLLARQLKRGVYKMFLEEQERQFSNSHELKFNFIREFARYDVGNFPLFYFNRKHGIIVMSEQWAKSPELNLTPESQMKYLMRNEHFIEFEFLGHVFSVPTSADWEKYANE